ncbi:MAG: hypothetical protein AABW49_01300 [Nanoarchaeota archaeon]
MYNGFRKLVATGYHSFCRDFELDEKFRESTETIVDFFQTQFMQNDIKYLADCFKAVGQQALKQAGYTE